MNPSPTVIMSLSYVIPSVAKNLVEMLRIDSAKNIVVSIRKNTEKNL
jgi:hypothetical protein